MTGLQPLARFAAARCRAPERYDFAGAIGWMPLNDTEYHLSAHHLPLSVRVLGGEPRLGALTHPGFLARTAVDDNGRWRAGYMPIALRTFPFVLAETPGPQIPGPRSPEPRPIDDLDVVTGSRLLGDVGVAVCSDPETGQLGPELSAIRNTLLMLKAGGARLSRALDLLVIAGVLVPLRGMDDRPAGDLTVNPHRFSALDAATVSALAHHGFLPLDLAAALLFSHRHLSMDRLPAPNLEGPAAAAPSPPPQADPMDFVLANLEAMNFALDGSDLFDMDDLEGLDARPEEEAEQSAQDEAAMAVPKRAAA